ncbi:DUF2782 domain-containing protein [Andreprevotia chitinilytica]|uniref:DUF2782 domain-containing protein n=1 Tax=Andreprevotia chitinilytica TaxID=396808 RepID=UPI00055480AA|nr:DUF2782 domain-containing protein [Andreprevotia chitinilytica]
MFTRHLLLAALLALPQILQAAEAPPPPPMPANAAPEGDDNGAEVRIIEKKDATVAEYRMHGKLYMMKVTPKVGPPYYLVDREGKGQFTRREMGQPLISPPQWVLFEW